MKKMREEIEAVERRWSGAEAPATRVEGREGREQYESIGKFRGLVAELSGVVARQEEELSDLQGMSGP